MKIQFMYARLVAWLNKTHWLKRIALSLLAVIVLLVSGVSIVFYVGMKPYRQLANSWVFREN